MFARHALVALDNGMQRTALRAAANAERWAGRTGLST
jgi:hypothetical protein